MEREFKVASGKKSDEKKSKNLSAAGKVRPINKYLKLWYKERAGKLKIFRLRKLKTYVVTIAGLEKDGLMADSKEEVIERFVVIIRWAGRNWYSIPSFEGMRL